MTFPAPPQPAADASAPPSRTPQSPPTAVGGRVPLLARLARPPAWLVQPHNIAALGVAIIMLYLLIDLPTAVRASQAPDALALFSRAASTVAFGGTNFILGFSLILLAAALRSHRLFALGLFIVVATAASGLTVTGLKTFFGRHRPSVYFNSGHYGLSFFALDSKQWSFPSGHSANVAALATVLWYAMPRGRAAWVLLALPLAASRVMVGAHFPSDVLAGAYVAILVTSALRGWFPAALPPTIAMSGRPARAPERRPRPGGGSLPADPRGPAPSLRAAR